MMMTKGVPDRLAVVSRLVLVGVLAGHVTAGRADAQGSTTGPGNPTILQAIAQLQNSVNTLQNNVNALQDSVNALQDSVNASQKKRFYLTPNATFNGAQALTACAASFHMASLWEILDPSGLKYDATEGYVNGDSGSGPPANTIGWIRTGGPTSSSSSGGAANCTAWQSTSGSGTVVELRQGWNSAASVASPWLADPEPCTDLNRVWCVEN